MITTEKLTLQDFHIDGVRHITPANALEAVKSDKAVIIDVREENEVALENIALDNVLYHPMSVILDRLPHISKDQNIITVCPGGVRSSKVANLLIKNDYPNVANLEGGLMMWKAQGLPFESNLSFTGGCTCGCSNASNDKNDGGCC